MSCDLPVSLWTTAPMMEKFFIPSTQARTKGSPQGHWFNSVNIICNTSNWSKHGLTLLYPNVSFYYFLQDACILIAMTLDSFPGTSIKQPWKLKSFFPKLVHYISQAQFTHGFIWWRDEYNERLSEDRCLSKQNNPLMLTIYIEFGYHSTMVNLFWTTKGSK